MAEISAAELTAVIKPNFFLIGPPKCGTTAVAYKLAQHPQIFMSEPKEPDYFVYQGGNPYAWDAKGKDSLQLYQSIFSATGAATAVGEASPYYICCHHVAAEVFNFNPDAKIIAVLRNPVYRALSMYRYWYSASGHRISMGDFVQSFKHEKLGMEFEFAQKHRVGWLKDMGFYFKHLDRYWTTFPRKQIKVLYYHDLITDFRSVYSEIFQFLGVEDLSKAISSSDVINKTYEPRLRWLHGILNQDQPKTLVSLLKRLPFASRLYAIKASINRLNEMSDNSLISRFPAAIYQEIIAEYLEDIAKLEKETGRNLAGWRDGSME